MCAKGKLTTTAPLLDLAGDDWGYGFNACPLLEVSPSTRFGLHYRSSIDLEIKGRAVSLAPAFNGPATLEVELPDSVEFSAVHDFGDWSVHGDVMWTNWSVLQQLALRIPDADRFWLAAGFSWEFRPCWTLDFGYAHIFADEVAITDGDAASGIFRGKAGGGADVVSLGISTTF